MTSKNTRTRSGFIATKHRVASSHEPGQKKGLETWSHKDLLKGQCTCSHHQSRGIVGPVGKLCNLTAKSNAEHFGFWVVAFTLAKFQNLKIVLPKACSFMWPTKKKVVRTKNLNSTCFIAERNWYHPEKVRVPFFLELYFWSIQLPKNYGCFFPPELKIQWNVEKMPVNYSNCRRNLMNFSNSWVQEKMFTRKKNAGFG